MICFSFTLQQHILNNSFALQVVCVDVRNTAAPLFTFQANSAEKKKDRENQAVSALSFSSRIPGMLATAGTDKMVKIWDVTDLSNENTPKLVNAYLYLCLY